MWSDLGPDYRKYLLGLVSCSLQSEGGAFESRRSRLVGRFGKAYIDELEVKVDDRCRVCLGSLCSVAERKAALLGRHCCLEKGSFFDLRRVLFRRRHQMRRCDLVHEAYWMVAGRKVVGFFHSYSIRERRRIYGRGNA